MRNCKANDEKIDVTELALENARKEIEQLEQKMLGDEGPSIMLTDIKQ